MIRRTCAAVRSMFSRFSAAAIASTLSAVTGSHLRSLGSKASNPPVRQALIHLSMVCGTAGRPARPARHAPARRCRGPPGPAAWSSALRPAPGRSAGTGTTRRPAPGPAAAAAHAQPKTPSAPPSVMTGNFPAPQGGARQRLCHRRTRVDRAGRPARGQQPAPRQPRRQLPRRQPGHHRPPARHLLMQRPQHRQHITGRARRPRLHTGSSTSRGSSPHSHACTRSARRANRRSHSRTVEYGTPSSADLVPRPAPRRRQQPRPDHLHPVLPAPQHRIRQQHPRHPARRAQRPPRPDPPGHPAQPDQVPLHPEPPPGQPPPAPRPQAPQQPRPELRIDNRHDLTYRWHRAPPSASDGPSGQAANLSRAGRSHSVMPTLTPGTAAPQAPPVMPAPPDA